MNDLYKARATILEVGEEAEAQRIDNFLLRRLKGVPKSHVYRVLRSGEVRVNSGRVKPDYRLRHGDRVRVPPVRVSNPGAKPKAKPAAFPIVFEDPALLVVEKPAGVAVHGGSGVSFGVIESLRAARPDAKMLELAHRLDRDTGGLVDDEQRRIFVDDREALWFRGRLRGRIGNADRRHPDPITVPQPVVGLDAPAVDAHLSAPEHPIHVTLRHALEPAQQEIVDALSLGFLADFEYRRASLV